MSVTCADDCWKTLVVLQGFISRVYSPKSNQALAYVDFRGWGQHIASRQPHNRDPINHHLPAISAISAAHYTNVIAATAAANGALYGGTAAATAAGAHTDGCWLAIPGRRAGASA